MRIVNAEQVPTGWMVSVAVPRAYTDGSGRIARVFISHEEAAGKTREELLAIVRRGIELDPVAALVGADLSRVQPAAPRSDRIAELRGKLEAIDSKIDTGRTTIERERP